MLPKPRPILEIMEEENDEEAEGVLAVPSTRSSLTTSRWAGRLAGRAGAVYGGGRTAGGSSCSCKHTRRCRRGKHAFCSHTMT